MEHGFQANAETACDGRDQSYRHTLPNECTNCPKTPKRRKFTPAALLSATLMMLSVTFLTAGVLRHDSHTNVTLSNTSTPQNQQEKVKNIPRRKLQDDQTTAPTPAPFNTRKSCTEIKSEAEKVSGRKLQNIFPTEDQDMTNADCDDRRHFYWIPKETQTPSDHPSLLPSIAPSLSPSDSITLEPSQSPSLPPWTMKPSTLKPSLSPITQYPTHTPSSYPTGTPYPTESMSPSVSMAPSVSLQPTEVPTILKKIDEGRGIKITTSPTAAPSTLAPTIAPTMMPISVAPTARPTAVFNVTFSATHKPTPAPVTDAPSLPPTTIVPTLGPTEPPVTPAPTSLPTENPTDAPVTALPTESPVTQPPTPFPTESSTGPPTQSPVSPRPTPHPTATFVTGIRQTRRPTLAPITMFPSRNPVTWTPTGTPSTGVPSISPSTTTPSLSPTTVYPTLRPTTARPTMFPTTMRPTLFPTTMRPTPFPTGTFRKEDLFNIESQEPTSSLEPTISMAPSASMAPSESEEPSSAPSLHPSTYRPTPPPTVRPSQRPTLMPTSNVPTTVPSVSPSTTMPSSRPSLDERRHFFWIPKEDRRQFFWIRQDDRRQFFWMPETESVPTRGQAGLDLQHHCLQSEILVDEDFEEPQAEKKWMHGTSSHSEDLTYFLGRLDGIYNPKVSQLFNVSRAHRIPPSNATIEFVLYTIDDWQPTDSLYVVIGMTTIDLGVFASSVQVDTYVNKKVEEGISWWRSILVQGSNLGFGATHDKKHLLEFSVPSDHFFPNGTLYFELRMETKRGGVETLSAGLDDFILETYYNCSGISHRQLGQNKGNLESTLLQTIPVTAATTVTNTAYCKADDFPCHQEVYDKDNAVRLVNICHYSYRNGYRNLCISEQDTNLLHFYRKDYCGRCLEGRTPLPDLSWPSLGPE